MAVTYKNLKIQNFKIYEDVEISFAGSGPGNLTIFVAKNAAGKTSLVDAIKWVLYDKVESRAGTRTPHHSLINRDSLSKTQSRCQGALTVNIDGTEYVFTRVYEPSFVDDSHLIVTKDGQGINETQGQDILQYQLIPENLSDFFFFDGEDLDELEATLNSGSVDLVQRIENILGLPAIDATLNTLGDYKKDVANRSAKLAGITQENEASLRMKNTIESRLELVTNEYQEIITDKNRIEQELESVNEQLKAHSTHKGYISEIEKCNLEETEENKQLEDTRTKFRSYSKDLWKDILSPISSQSISRFESELKVLRESQQKYWERKGLEDSLNGPACTTCGATLSDAAKSDIRDKIDRLGPNIDPTREIGDLETKLEHLRQITSSNVVSYMNDIADEKNNHYSNLQTIRNRRREAEATLNNLNIDRSQIDQNDRKRSELIKELGITERALKDYNDPDIDLVTSNLISSKHIPSLQSELDRLENESLQGDIEDEQIAQLKKLRDLSVESENIIKTALTTLKSTTKQDIGNKSSEYFNELFTDENYSGLEINDKYALNIISASDGKIVTLPSAGSSQMVGMALMSAMSDLSVVDAPLIMDTGFGRIDNENRENAMNHFSKFKSQVILMLLDSEITPEQLAKFDNFIGKKYEIHKTFGSSLITET